MNKQQKIESFDPSQPGLADASVFGLPFTAEESEIIIVPVPWEVTVSYGAGTSEGPNAILDASFQVDLQHQEFPELWKLGIYMDEAPEHWATNSAKYKSLAQPIIEALEAGEDVATFPALQSDLDKINKVCKDLKNEVKDRVLHWMKQGKKVVLLGGDHSTPLGYYEALASQHESFGILHLDAHMDLRIAYEGFTYSHASIMYNTLQIPQVSKIVQVGIRDFCEQEVEVAQKEGNRVLVHTDMDLKAETFEGKTWAQQCDDIIASLPEKVCISFDIDGMYPWYCPNTGTPVPGGFSFEQAAYLLSRLAETNKEIIGFDLVEVAPGDDDWDGNVGARMLFHMCGVLAKSQKRNVGQKIKFNR
ncbi:MULTISPECIES: agmatinase family protein [Flavobacterium]|jgi:agmatinase|uniref:Agmatinase family protein n=1 Tax=Flavobacterium supellecticarium TaxID=2565924 RepID=A0A4S3ZTY7_9FLAO|nr:agmatinase family protein [Flavobacterium supellecticarium]MPT35126.1 agmatinase family protein [Flavobacterium sp.]THF49100.1 agmatinase family protein [Flavobacterium supellecticarium]